ncbi:hypothetical protein [Parapedobacter soli]|uniref:hypothetical protein n=1 Tax=Parapedobacter soli TaxID=416955 RepID=UPI0021C8A264|nr:hypothetical protein [Parapedobacter soli]
MKTLDDKLWKIKLDSTKRSMEARHHFLSEKEVRFSDGTRAFLNYDAQCAVQDLMKLSTLQKMELLKISDAEAKEYLERFYNVHATKLISMLSAKWEDKVFGEPCSLNDPETFAYITGVEDISKRKLINLIKKRKVESDSMLVIIRKMEACQDYRIVPGQLELFE